jgi:pyrimidine deaminase RibD-like protein
MLIVKKLPGGMYPRITQAPMSTYAEFLNFFRDGQTIDDNTNLTTDYTIPNAMFRVSIASGYLTKTTNMAIPDEFLADCVLTAAGAELIQTAMDRKFCELAIAEAQKSKPENDGELHPHVGAVVVKDSKILATGYRGESGEGNHGEYCALKKLNAADVQGATVYTTLEPCTERKPPKKPCTERLIESKVTRVVYGMADKHESVYGHSSLVEAGIEIGFFPNDLMPELLALNKEWSDSLRSKQGFPRPNETKAIANASYYKPGTSMRDNIRLVVRPPREVGVGFYTVEDMDKTVLAFARTLEKIGVEWCRIDTQKVIIEKRIRQTSGSSNPLLNL